MIDGFAYPQGDVETWVEGTAEDVIEKPAADLAAMLAKAQGAAHAFHWRRSEREVMYLQARMVGGTLPIDENIGNEAPQIRIRDRGSGMAYAPTEPLTFDRVTIRGEENELLRAGTLRLLLQKNLNTAAIDDHMSRITSGDPSVMSTPIAEYEASTKEEYLRVLAEIEHLLIKRAKCKSLWLRGQCCEFPYPRPPEVKDWLKLGPGDVPSLVPRSVVMR